MTASEAPPQLNRELQRRYTRADLVALTDEEAHRFVRHGAADPRTDIELAWELLYRREPHLYDRLVGAERLHPGVLAWLPDSVDRVVEVGAGTGRLTLELIHRANEVVAIEPARPLRAILNRKLGRADQHRKVCVREGFFDQLPIDDDFADLVVACSAFTPSAGHGGDSGLVEMERVCKPGGLVAIVWPNNLDWLAARGYRYLSFEGDMSVEFASLEDAAELTDIFYPNASTQVRHCGQRRVSYEALGINPPRDVAFKVKAA